MFGVASISIEYLLNSPGLQISEMGWTLDQASNPQAKVFISAKLFPVQ
jgi:hypothetical protein